MALLTRKSEYMLSIWDDLLRGIVHSLGHILLQFIGITIRMSSIGISTSKMLGVSRRVFS
jgi:hypothetical protein